MTRSVVEPSSLTPVAVVNNPRWLLLIHQIPPKPDYLRVKIGRRLQQIGAVAIKNSVYVLPDHADALESFQWVRAEIVDGGGSGSICRADFVDGLTNDQLRTLFQRARDADYAEISVAARALLPASRGRNTKAAAARPAPSADAIARLRHRLTTVQAIDWFDAPERTLAQQAVERVSASQTKRAGPTSSSMASASTLDRGGERSGYRGRRWVTRENVFVDRIASAWFIKRFVDPDAEFAFVPAEDSGSVQGGIRFDMFGGEFTHRGDRCTFEVLCDEFAPDDAALGSLAEIVHDIDLRDAKFGREDAAGIERVLMGIVKANRDDPTRIARGAQLFDELYALKAAELSPERPNR